MPPCQSIRISATVPGFNGFGRVCTDINPAPLHTAAWVWVWQNSLGNLSSVMERHYSGCILYLNHVVGNRTPKTIALGCELSLKILDSTSRQPGRAEQGGKGENDVMMEATTRGRGGDDDGGDDEGSQGQKGRGRAETKVKRGRGSTETEESTEIA